jgi:hypothetical protein
MKKDQNGDSASAQISDPKPVTPDSQIKKG